MDCHPHPESQEECCCHTPKHGAELDGLARIEGQVRGIRRMVAEGRYCVDILNQTRAVHAALRRIERRILKAHLETCVQEAFHHGSEEDRARKIAEILNLLDRTETKEEP